MSSIAPLDYRSALDAISPLYQGQTAPVVICNLPELANELENRFCDEPGPSCLASVIWIEPLVETWNRELRDLSARLAEDGTLYIIASRPLARLLPERRAWTGNPLGLRFSGSWKLHAALRQAGFDIHSRYGFHGLQSIGLNLIGAVLVRLGRADLADRLQFAARLRYCTRGVLSGFSTVSLVAATKTNLSRLSGESHV
jgi:hypothetical protein